MTHLPMWEDDDASWGDHVTDEEYDAATRRDTKTAEGRSGGLRQQPAGSSLSGLVRLDDVGRDPPTGGQLVPVLARPLTNGLRVHLARGSGGGACTTGVAGPPSTRPPAVLDIDVERLAQSGRVLGRQVNLVLATIEPEGDGLVCRLAVGVVGELRHDSLCHERIVEVRVRTVNSLRASPCELLSTYWRLFTRGPDDSHGCDGGGASLSTRRRLPTRSW